MPSGKAPAIPFPSAIEPLELRLDVEPVSSPFSELSTRVSVVLEFEWLIHSCS